MKEYFEKDMLIEIKEKEIKEVTGIQKISTADTILREETAMGIEKETRLGGESTATSSDSLELLEHVREISHERPPLANKPPHFDKFDEDMRYRREKNNLKSKTIAACLIATFSFGSLGLGLGLGGAFFGNLFSSSETPELQLGNPTPIEALVEATATTISFEGNSTVPQVISAIQDAVVSINVTVPSQQSFFSRSGEQAGSGSGIIFSQDDEKVYIVTNNHVIDSANKVTISIDDSTNIKAGYVGSNEQYDIAVISVLKSDLKANGIDDITIAEFGDSAAARVGETVVAIGNALGEGKSATLGIVSALDKTVVVEGSREMLLMQTDAAINHGNSGGPLVNAEGKVIGINTAKYSDYSVEGMGFSIPINTVKSLIDDMLVDGAVEKPYLGISGLAMSDMEEEVREDANYPDGVLIMQVLSGGSAAESGIKVYDIITEYNGQRITTMDELSTAIASSKIGDKIMVTVYREGTGEVGVYVTIKDMNSTKF